MNWTQDIRRKLYSRLVSEIGAHGVWDAKIKPAVKREQYDRLLSALAREFSQEIGQPCAETAIQQQVNFATTTQAEFTHRSLIKNYVLNKAAALEVGFITSDELPKHLSID
jgi:regulator of sirC expression with transglutaminase-like and TPR domain